MNKISVYTILYHDLQFYEDIINNIYDKVDEFIIIDGPYSYAVDTLKNFNLYYEEHNKPDKLNELIQKYPKIKYKYAICNTEEEKRMMGYTMCSNNLVLLVDTDEFLDIDTIKLNSFIEKNEKNVCCANIYNMCDYNINYNKLTKKYILFKKNKISALEHLNYTWLIGCKQTEKNIDYMCFDEFGLIYHFTLNRNIKNNTVKFIFYVLLYRKLNNSCSNLFDNYDNDELSRLLTIDEILNIFIHFSKNRINIPNLDDDNNKLELIEDNPFIVFLEKYDNSKDFYFTTQTKYLLNVPVNFRLNKTKETFVVLFENVKNVNVNVYYLYLNAKPEKITYTYVNVNEITIQNNSSSNVIYIYIELVCTQTYDDTHIFTIKNIS